MRRSDDRGYSSGSGLIRVNDNDFGSPGREASLTVLGKSARDLVIKPTAHDELNVQIV